MTSPLCNGNCMQGRKCDCVVPYEDEIEKPDLFTQIVDLLLAAVVVAMIVGFAFLVERSWR